jgi:CheY-like chemotaxis protein
VRDSLVDVLARCADEVVAVSDGLEAWAVLRQRDVRSCVLVTDLDMPRMDGTTLIVAIRRDRSLDRVRIVALSANRCSRLPVDGTLRKPFENVELDAMVRRLFGAW